MKTNELLVRLENDPPQVHPSSPRGVWSASRDCLEFLATTVQEHWTTLETGCGASTAVFAAAGSCHVSVALSADEGKGATEWCRRNNVDDSKVKYLVGSSEVVLPAMENTKLDLVFIDGCHAFPIPIVDWCYTAPRLRAGGIMVVDDLQLEAPDQMAHFLRCDPRWVNIADTKKWGAWSRTEGRSINEGWAKQSFFNTKDHHDRMKSFSTQKGLRHRWQTIMKPTKTLQALKNKLFP